MPTKRRQKSFTDFYHVIVKGINKEKIYNQQREKIYFKKIILKYLKKYDVEIYAYCIMSNHAHLIIKAELQVLSLFMAVVLAEYANYYNYKHYRNGHVFQNRFISECIETDAYYWNCMRYIHLNPVKAGMVRRPERYKYSSMAEYMLEMPGIIHSNAIKKYTNTFTEYEEFEKFHGARDVQVFADIKEEMMAKQKDAALLIAEEICEERNLMTLLQVFEESELQDSYISRLVKTLKISKKIAKKLCNILMNELQNK